jgi:hypothetical protein
MLAALGALAVSCMMSGAPCPCGQTFEQDPFGSDDPFYVGPEHDEEAHCFCRCGDGPRERLAPSDTCEGYESPCETRNGEIARYSCE